ncbi:hypothetical protein [Streptomyces spectabilis]|uniref:Uncharacterized protein n=1 Tax=Streptomyces spectabilis TaxID=68270 RepID=A0A7W8AQK8_STRST|nr:hypothetical protein [Streptomyces spectabilis]MBB5101525.1 hypothetical protein [Streptomyces spectabilis]MCI3900714.1 hypothetical protein [Streptomyces spectabilis]GGV11938.1 hypothetical protein GCM10010245_22090 [Streptomyces spectabilis]
MTTPRAGAAPTGRAECSSPPEALRGSCRPITEVGEPVLHRRCANVEESAERRTTVLAEREARARSLRT